jgi:mRNA interferase RelE/StbE
VKCNAGDLTLTRTLAWQIKVSESAGRSLAKLDKLIPARIIKFLRETISALQDALSTGKALTGAVFGSYWRYRVGDYRLICHIQDGELCILVIEIGNRKEVYP